MDIVEISSDQLHSREYVRYILSCDIGGTHCRFGIIGAKKDESCEILGYYIQRTSTITSNHIFVDVINNFLKQIHEDYGISISACVIAAAGPVDDNTVDLVNNNLSLSAEYIKQSTMLHDVLILNDLEAIAYGVYYNKKNMQNITPHLTHEENASFLVVAPGTGLGVATVIPRGRTPIVMPMEGGHMDFPSYDDIDYELDSYIRYLRKEDKPIEFEDVVSGRGIINIFKYLTNKEPDKEHIDVIHAHMMLRYDVKIIPMLISRYIVTNKLCQVSMDIFFRYLARFCKNLCLANLTKGGLYIGGGMIEHNKMNFNIDTFVLDFVEHTNTHFSEILAEIPIFMFSDSFMGVKGAARALLEIHRNS